MSTLYDCKLENVIYVRMKIRVWASCGVNMCYFLTACNVCFRFIGHGVLIREIGRF